ITLQLAPEVPFLLISGTVGEEVAVESIKAGAADYLMKQNLIRFVPAVAPALRDAAERQAMRRAEAGPRGQRALLSMIYDNTSDALILFTWDPAEAAWKLTSVNRSTLLMGKVAGAALNEGDLVGRRFEDAARALTAFWGGNADDLLDDFHRVAESGRTRTREARLAEGTAGVHVEITLIPFFGPDGRSRHVLAAARD